MKTGLQTVLDVMLLVLMLAVGIPAVLFATNVFLKGPDFGFGSFDEKSVVATAAQMTHLGIGNELDGKRLWTDTHFMMLRVVDYGAPLGSANRTTVGNGAIAVYTISDYELNKQKALDEGYLFARDSGLTDWDNEQYHLAISPDGSITLGAIRQEVN